MPLTMAALGSKNFVKKISGKDETRRFLESLGVVEGASITIVSQFNGNLIINIKDTRVALDKDMARRIMI